MAPVFIASALVLCSIITATASPDHQLCSASPSLPQTLSSYPMDLQLDLSDSMLTTEFRELPEPVLRRALDTLVRRGKAQIIRAAAGEGDGVRFL